MLLEAGLAFSSRLLLLALCRGYLSRSLLYDLQDLSGKSVSPDKAIERNGNDVELDTLPTPSVHSPRSRPTFATAGSRSLHSEVAQTVFSVCLTESSLMFGMLMCQGMDLLEPHVRMRHWKISLFILMTIVLVIIPLSLSLVVNVGSGLGAHSRPEATNKASPINRARQGISVPLSPRSFQHGSRWHISLRIVIRPSATCTCVIRINF
jgi:hypothetical protein